MKKTLDTINKVIRNTCELNDLSYFYKCNNLKNTIELDFYQDDKQINIDFNSKYDQVKENLLSLFC